MSRVINEKGVFEIRHAERGDLDYMLHSWQLTWEQSPEMQWPGMIRDEYFRHAHLMLDELLSRSSQAGSLYVCHHKGSPHLIRGFLCAEAFRLGLDADGKPIDMAYIHWVQVKKPEWNKGVASALIERFKRDFLVKEDQNIFYTFASKVIKNRPLMAKACQRHNLVAWPWFKYTSQEPGWEAG